MQPYEEVLAAYEPYLTGKIQNISEVKTVFPQFESSVIQKLIDNSILLMKKVPTLVKVPSQAIIIGDLHGNVTDLIRLLSKFLDQQDTHYVFLGDYVDRGVHSVAVITLLLAFFNKYPNNVTLIRGNHEFSHINQLYGFYDEIISNYQDESLWDSFQILFAWLPLAAIINSQIFCVHGGLSPMLLNANQIDEIKRPVYDYDNQPMIADLVWSDPNDNVQTYVESHRGSGVLFGTEALHSFLVRSKLKAIVRAHQCVADGFSFFSNSMGVTVFSCSDYCRLIHNNCGAMKIQKGEIDLYSFPPEGNFASLQPRVTMTFNSESPGMKRTYKKMEIAIPPIKSTASSTVISPKSQQPIRKKGRRVARKKAARKAGQLTAMASPAGPPSPSTAAAVAASGAIGINGISKAANKKITRTPKRRVTAPRLSPKVPLRSLKV
ncbi:hypothetical protein M9Y10_001037 [Tritrichomonas musculus]|uniref:Serine/threonine-protein phosphatase n=2 Tax=Tritrichomonas musculus TaxID=1915356 RepID=A0ABR2L911_9EUKA